MQAEARQESATTLVFAMLAGGFASLATLATAFVALGMNQDWLLYGASRMLAGAHIYGPEVMESNPPFILWLSAVPVAAAHFFHLPLHIAFRAFVLFLTVASLAWCAMLLRRLFTAKRHLFFWASATGLFAATFCLAQMNDAGEREHFFVLFALPYLCAAALRLSDRNLPRMEAFAAGLSAAVAVCCKPQHLLAIIAVELLLAIRGRSLRSLSRPEFAAIVTGGVAYLASVQIFAPQYLHNVIPLLRQTYWAFGGVPLSRMLVQKRSLLLVILIVLCAAIVRLMRPRLQSANVQLALLAAATGSLSAYWIQETGFHYHLIPTSIFLGLATLLLLADCLTLRQSRSQAPAWLAHLAFAAMAAVVFAGFQKPLLAHAQRAAAQRFDSQTQALLDSYPAGTPVYWMTPAPAFFPAAFEHNFFYAGRFMHLWLVPAIVRNERHEAGLHVRLTPIQVAALTAEQNKDMVEDLEHLRPRLVAVEKCYDHAAETCEGMGDEYVNLLQWFSRDPAFAQAWSRYKFLESAGRFDFYSLEDSPALRTAQLKEPAGNLAR